VLHAQTSARENQIPRFAITNHAVPAARMIDRRAKFATVLSGAMRRDRLEM